jgi:hypothetical protein
MELGWVADKETHIPFTPNSGSTLQLAASVPMSATPWFTQYMHLLSSYPQAICVGETHNLVPATVQRRADHRQYTSVTFLDKPTTFVCRDSHTRCNSWAATKMQMAPLTSTVTATCRFGTTSGTTRHRNQIRPPLLILGAQGICWAGNAIPALERVTSVWMKKRIRYLRNLVNQGLRWKKWRLSNCDTCF